MAKTPEKAPPRQKGSGTLALEAGAAAEERADDRRREELAAAEVRDARQDERTDKAYGLALEQANKRGDDAEKQLESQKDSFEKQLVSKDRNITKAALFMAIQMLVILALAGHEVYLQFDKSGNVTVEVEKTDGEGGMKVKAKTKAEAAEDTDAQDDE